MNEFADELHSMTGTQQRVTSAYHPQSNGLVEHQNRKIKMHWLRFWIKILISGRT